MGIATVTAMAAGVDGGPCAGNIAVPAVLGPRDTGKAAEAVGADHAGGCKSPGSGLGRNVGNMIMRCDHPLQDQTG